MRREEERKKRKESMRKRTGGSREEKKQGTDWEDEEEAKRSTIRVGNWSESMTKAERNLQTAQTKMLTKAQGSRY